MAGLLPVPQRGQAYISHFLAMYNVTGLIKGRYLKLLVQ